MNIPCRAEKKDAPADSPAPPSSTGECNTVSAVLEDLFLEVVHPVWWRHGNK